MTPERIAEIAAEIHVFGKQCGDRWLSATELAELCRLARLGLRVEGAIEAEVEAPFYVGLAGMVECPAEMIGKRVALVVLEDSN